MDELQPGQNTGFIESLPTLTDWKASGETGSTAQPLNFGGDWRSSEPPGEWQKLMGVSVNGGSGFETDACVTFSALDSLETYGNFILKKGLWPVGLVQWLHEKGYFNPDGTLNFSDRFIAKLSGTTAEGNTLGKVWDTIKHQGLVPEAMWPFPVEQIKADPQNAWNTYYAEVPAEAIALGKEFASKFLVGYEWVAYPGAALTPDQFAVELEKGPLQLCTRVCPPWNTDQVIAGCGGLPTGHATMLSYVEPLTSFHILDHYVPFDKKFALDYVLTYAMRGTIAPQVPPPPPAPFHHVFSQYLTLGMGATDEVHALQQALQTLKDGAGTPYLKGGIFGPYGPQTQSALARFQKDHGIVDVPPGAHCGPKTRAALNSLLNN